MRTAHRKRGSMSTPMRHTPRTLAALAALAALLLLAGCAEKSRVAAGRLDTPEHHTLRGHDLIDEGKWDEAGRSFDLAISLGGNYAPAYAGKAIVVAHAADSRTASQAQRDDVYLKAKKYLDDAKKYSKNDDEERAYHVAAIRVYRLAKSPPDWLDEAEDHYRIALKRDPRNLDPDPHFYMARARRDAFQLNQAQELYRKVLAMNTPKTGQADRELALVQKILRAEPGSRHGRVIAFDDTISRGDISALFVEELRLDRLYKRGGAGQVDTGFKPPVGQQAFQADRMVKAPEANDIADHPLRADIEQVLELKVTGLQPDPAHQFHPNATVLRGEFAMMVEDILVKVTGEQGLKTKFIGQASPFRDVRNDVPWFNAIQTVSSRSLMEPVDKINGIFKPGDPITGADALLVIRLVKDELRSYVR
jgi:S-layer homology domain